jgi:hypothetical protein
MYQDMAGTIEKKEKKKYKSQQAATIPIPQCKSKSTEQRTVEELEKSSEQKVWLSQKNSENIMAKCRDSMV